MMSAYHFHQMDDTDANKIAGWRYDPPYDFYDWDADPEDLAELQDAEQRRDVYFSVRDKKGQLLGFFQFEQKDEVVDVGLGLEFMLEGLEFARRRFDPEGFSLSVATFNERAIQVYERAGFRRGEVYTHHTNGADYPFLRMTREA